MEHQIGQRKRGRDDSQRGQRVRVSHLTNVHDNIPTISTASSQVENMRSEVLETGHECTPLSEVVTSNTYKRSDWIPVSKRIRSKRKLVKRASQTTSQIATSLSSRLDHVASGDQGDEELDKEDDICDTLTQLGSSYIDEGDPIHQCEHCGALMWSNERLKSSADSDKPKFSICCSQGKIQVPFMKPPPDELCQLFFNKQTVESKNFLKNIRSYNNMFCFTSMGGKVDRRMNSRGGGPYSFVLSGQNHHLIGSLLPSEGRPPVYSQLYIYDTENEVTNRISAVSNHGGGESLDPYIVQKIKQCLDNNNAIVKQYRAASTIISSDNVAQVHIRLVRNPSTNVDNRLYNMPTASEVAALIVGDLDRSYTKRDIIVRKQSGSLQRIDELHSAYLPLQYPIIFHYGDNGYDSTIQHNQESLAMTKKKKKLTPREYVAFRLMHRKSEQSVLLHSKKLLQQFIVDAYSMVESDRLDYFRKHQKELRVDLYSGISDAITRGETDPSSTGRRVILPSSFTGGARYMIQNYQDAMAICVWAGNPDLFLTFTCNPAWPEIIRHCTREDLNASDSPEILSRIFSLKLDALMNVLRDDKIFGTIKAEVYTIEFQKRGLPHAHIILWLLDADKPKTPSDVDKIISSEIPDKDEDPELYELVRNYMMHGPCGGSHNKSACMKDGFCSKFFPKEFVNNTIVDEKGYPTYRRRQDGRTVERKGVKLDNRYVVPYNATLLKLFRAHLNVEKTNQTCAIKYLFKYVTKGPDRVIAGIYNNSDSCESQRPFDEIAHYLNCRYISSCEAAWRIFSFEIHHRFPPVQRLSFHLPQQQPVYYSRHDTMSSLLDQPRIKESMFLSWMQKNKDDPYARKLTYLEFPNHFTFDKMNRMWKFRQRSGSVGRLAHVTPSQGELFYLQLMLTKVKGPKCYEDIRTVNGVVHSTFREACYSLGLLNDDQEFVDAIKEASLWASGNYLRRFFVSMLLSHSLSQPSIVWEQTKKIICEDLLYVSHNDPRHSGTNSSFLNHIYLTHNYYFFELKFNT